jgi:4'-phosphopantetheinyl transferase
MFKAVTWLEAPESLSLSTDEVHVWRVELDQPEHVLEKFRDTLDEHELYRASRFHFEKHRRHFVAGRGVLRQLLAQYLDAKPKALRIAYGAYGKPALNGEHKNSRLRFNMSHSHEVALLAFAEDKELGVDVEHIRADFASEEIARRYFSRREVETFNTLPNHEQVAAFFRCWTRKEAYIKAIGKGLWQPLDQFDVTLAAEQPAALLWCNEDDASRWSMYNLEIGSDYAGALAVEGQVSRIRCWRMTNR